MVNLAVQGYMITGTGVVFYRQEPVLAPENSLSQKLAEEQLKVNSALLVSDKKNAPPSWGTRIFL